MEKNQTFEKRGPIVETQITLSKDNRFMIHRSMITDIKPVNYYHKVMKNLSQEEKPTN